MTELELIRQWNGVRWHLIVSQLAPTFLLTITVGLLATGLRDAPFSVRVAAAGILLASGILGALVQISTAGEALAVAADLRAVGTTSALGARIVASAPWVNVVRFVSPAIFVVVFIALVVALFPIS